MPHLGTKITIPRALNKCAESANALALSWYRDGELQTRYTFGNLHEKVTIAASNLTRLKVRPTDRVVVLSNNSPEMFFLLLAIMTMRAIAVPINPEESPRFLTHILSTLDPKLVVIGSCTGGIVEETSILCKKVAINELFTIYRTNAFDLSATNVKPSDIAVILFTSGTTSEPKGVCLSHFNLLTNAQGLYKTHNLSKNTVHMCVLPLFHANAFGFSLVTSLYAVNHVVLCNGMPGFTVWSIINNEMVNIVSVVPQILQILGARSPSKSLSVDLQYFVSAAAPLSKEVASKFIATTGVNIHQGYGLSECVNFATTIPGDILDSTYQEVMFGEKVPSIGTPLDGCNVFVRRLGGTAEALQGEEGEIIVTGDTLMPGYWRNKEASQNAIVKNGLKTGDLGFYKVLDNRRFFFITGRIKEIIIRQGEKISPLAIEVELQALYSLGNFAVAGFENTASGEEIGLYLQIKDKANLARVSKVVNTCARLSRPRLVMIGHQDIPITATGKVKRDILENRFTSFSNRVFGNDLIIVDETHLDNHT